MYKFLPWKKKLGFLEIYLDWLCFEKLQYSYLDIYIELVFNNIKKQIFQLYRISSNE